MKNIRDTIEVLIFGVLYTSPFWIAGLVILALTVGAVGGLVYLIKG